MKILILGGTRYFGRSVARQFKDSGADVHLFSRVKQLPDEISDCKLHRGDRNKEEDLKSLSSLGSFDVIFDNLAFQGEHVKSLLSILKPTGRYIVTSSVSVYRYIPEPKPGIFTESEVAFDYKPPAEMLSNPHWSYARGKLEVERELREHTSLAWTVIRPSVIFGPDDATHRGLWYLARLLDGGPICLADGGRNSFRLAYSHDVARAVVTLVKSPHTIRKAYHLTQKEIITLSDFVEAGARALGVQSNAVNIPMEFLGDLAGPYAPMTNFIPSIQAAEKDFGYSTIPFADAMQETCDWFKVQARETIQETLATRSQELELALKWKESASSFPQRKPL